MMKSFFTFIFGLAARCLPMLPGIYAREGPRTGSWRNCTSVANMDHSHESSIGHHPDSGFEIIVSCDTIHYRIPKSSIEKINQSLVVGVLSGASTTIRRSSIRSTWAYKKKNVFFIVAGPWENISEEYHQYNDLIWIDKEEVYVTETSVLTFKTESFLSIFHAVMQKNENIKYLLKTDDDSYVNLKKLEENLMIRHENDLPIHYWGKCHDDYWKPHRNQEIEWQKKWYISFETYAEPNYPPYCQGAGIALSRNFLDCAINHIPKIKYMPNEDVAVGMLAERCEIPITNNDGVWIRWDNEDGITMDGKIIQHYVRTDTDMRLHHYSATGVRGPILL